MTKLTRQRARQAARSDAEAAAKLIAVQEAQIEALKAEAAAYAAVLVGVCELYGLWDGDFMVPQIAAVYESGRMPPLLMGGGE